ncbi:MAG: glycosyltransferase family 1 protein, partial [Bacilli bacterium]|nr:glycosyltransferase family 1 protein [Bacilli bacterium]
MKKILIISNMDITIYLFRKEIIKRLVDEKYRVIILCPNGEKLEYFSKIGCEIVDLKMNRH